MLKLKLKQLTRCHAGYNDARFFLKTEHFSQVAESFYTLRKAPWGGGLPRKQSVVDKMPIASDVSFSPQINNIKGHITLQGNGITQLRKELEQNNSSVWRKIDPKRRKDAEKNFIVVKDQHRQTYIIFPHKGFVNITGVKNYSAICEVIPKFCETFRLCSSDVSQPVLVIDNISAAGNFHKTVNLSRLQKKINTSEEKLFSVHCNRQYYPGAFCKRKGVGTITVFASGKYVIVGAKCREDVTTLAQLMHAVICKL